MMKRGFQALVCQFYMRHFIRFPTVQNVFFYGCFSQEKHNNISFQIDHSIRQSEEIQIKTLVFRFLLLWQSSNNSFDFGQSPWVWNVHRKTWQALLWTWSKKWMLLNDRAHTQNKIYQSNNSLTLLSACKMFGNIFALTQHAYHISNGCSEIDWPDYKWSKSLIPLLAEVWEISKNFTQFLNMKDYDHSVTAAIN